MTDLAGTVRGFRVSPLQRRLYLSLGEGAPRRSFALVEMRGELDRDALEAAARLLAARHDALRTRYVRPSGIQVPVQVVAEPEQAADGVVVDWRDAEPETDEWGDEVLRVTRWPGEGETAGGPVHRVRLAVDALSVDRGSLRTLVEELTAILGGGDEELAEALRYVHFAEWQNELLEEGEGLEHWRRRQPRSDASEPAPGQGGEGPRSRRRWTADEASVAGVRRMARELEIDEEAVWLACWTSLHHRLSPRPSLTVGWVTEGRSYEDFEGAVGLFARRLPLELAVTDDTRWADLVREIDARVTEDREWQDSFWWSGQGEDGDERGAWDLGFELVASPSAGPSGGLAVRWIDDEAVIDRVRLALTVERRSDRVDLVLVAEPGGHGVDELELLAGRFDTLLSDLAERPTTTELGDLRVASAADRQAASVLERDGDHPLGETVTDLVLRHARRSPDALAVVDDGGRLTHGELDERTARLARALGRRGVEPESLVGLHLDHSIDLVVALVAVLRTGAGYVPLDSTQPAERLALVLEDARPELILGAPVAGDHGIATTSVADLSAEAGVDAEPAVGPSPEGVCYVIYTSGSTGRPKGVAVPHRAVANYLRWCAERYFNAEGGSSPVHSPLGFDLTVTSLLGPLASGGSVLMIPDRRGLEGLSEAVGEEPPPALVKITPAHLALLEQTLPAGRSPAVAGALVVGGEALHGEALAPWAARSRRLRLINEYGPTEATVGCAVFEVVIGSEVDGAVPAGPVPIGGPISHTRLHVVDRRLRRRPRGTDGELIVGGAGLARGYLGRPRETAERFVPDPFSGAPGERLYRTGDLVRQLATGELEFVRRIDDQVKLRGYRIEPGEVESALRRLDGVRDVAVMVRDDLPAGRALVAYLVPQASAELDLGEVRARLRESLPDYMVPSLYELLQGLPLTVHGKVDRQALPRPSRVDDGEVTAPATVPEMRLAKIWEELLGRRPIGVDEDFFEIGGHSLMAARMMAQIARRFGRDVPLVALVTEGATIRDLARLLAAEPTAEWSPLVDMQRGEDGVAPLFFLPTFGGHVLPYLELVRRLSPSIPVWGLQTPGRQTGETQTSVEALVAILMEAVRSVQPHGPYRLAGWSFGGVLAFEMARQLRASGEEVELLALLDPDLRHHRDRARTDAEYLIEMVGDELSITLDDLGDGEDLDQLIGIAMERLLATGRSLPEGFDLPYFRRLFHFYKTTYDARQAYVPRPAEGSATYFLSAPKLSLGVPDPTVGARDLLREGLEIVVLPAHHQQFVDPENAALLAAILDRRLHPLDARSPNRPEPSAHSERTTR